MMKDYSADILLLCLALFCDGFQALIGLGLSGIFTVFSSIFNVIPIIGQGLNAGTSLFGALFGGAIDVTLSFMFTAVLGSLLFLFDRFYPRYVLFGGGLEVIPFLDILPGYTAMVGGCIWRKHFGTHSVIATVAGAAVGTAAATGATALATAAPRNTQSMDGIKRPANDNTPTAAYAA